MKRAFLYLFLLTAAMPLSSVAMVPAPGTPSCQSPIRLSSPACAPSLVSARLSLYNKVFKAAIPTHDKEFNDQDFDSSFLTASPQAFLKQMRAKISEHIFLAQGITQKEIGAAMLEAQNAIEASNDVEKNYFDHMSSPLKKEVEQLFKHTPENLHLRKTDDQQFAYVNGNVLVVNEDLLSEVAPTPRRRKVIFNHEFSHMENNDQARKRATQQLLQERRKKNAPSAQQALITPHDLSPTSKNSLQQVIRLDEAFADINASNSPVSAAAAHRLWQTVVENGQVAVDQDHPSPSSRLEIAQAMIHVHKASALNIRKRKTDEGDETQLDCNRAHRVARRLKFEENLLNNAHRALPQGQKPEKNK